MKKTAMPMPDGERVAQLRSCIDAYVSDARKLVDELLGLIPPDELPQRAWKRGLIPTSGTLPSGATFLFHGIGCRFDWADGPLDLEFAADGRCDGFDVQRLWLYASGRPLRYPALADRKGVEFGMEVLDIVGHIERQKIFVSSLYFRSRTWPGPA